MKKEKVGMLTLTSSLYGDSVCRLPPSSMRASPKIGKCEHDQAQTRIAFLLLLCADEQHVGNDPEQKGEKSESHKGLCIMVEAKAVQ